MLDLWLTHSPLRDLKTNMVLSDLILGWSLLVTGHADSFIISYIYILTCKIFSLLYCCENELWQHIFITNIVTATKHTVAPKICPLWDLGSIPYGKNRKVLGAYLSEGLSNVLLLGFNSSKWRGNPMCYL